MKSKVIVCFEIDLLYNNSGDFMKTIVKNIINEIEINKSRFITLLYVVNSKDDVIYYLKCAKEDYPNATHYCYAYIIDAFEKASDDGEPSKTAGAPILNVLKQNNLNHILCIVIRYFGGIKLGAGGLVRAYTNATNEGLKKTTIGNLVKAYKVRFVINYSDIDKLNYLLRDEKVVYKEFGDKVIYEVLMPKNKLSSFEMFKYEMLEDCYLTI